MQSQKTAANMALAKVKVDGQNTSTAKPCGGTASSIVPVTCPLHSPLRSAGLFSDSAFRRAHRLSVDHSCDQVLEVRHTENGAAAGGRRGGGGAGVEGEGEGGTLSRASCFRFGKGGEPQLCQSPYGFPCEGSIRYSRGRLLPTLLALPLALPLASAPAMEWPLVARDWGPPVL